MTHAQIPLSLIWLRNDLRLHDNPALNAALKHGNCIAVYIREPQKSSTRARDWWLHHSLGNFKNALAQHNIPLVFMQGDATDVLPQFVQEQKIDHIFWNRRYTPEGIDIDTQLKEKLNATSFRGNLLLEPWEIKNKTGSFYKVFTPMWKDLQTRNIPDPVNFIARQQNTPKVRSTFTCVLDDLKLIDDSKNWHHALEKCWHIGEDAALKKFRIFLTERILHYKDNRDYPHIDATSRISPHLHFGEISVRDIWAQLAAFEQAHNLEGHDQTLCFKSELAWREFSYQILYNYEDIDQKAIKPAFDTFPWQSKTDTLKKWQHGQTGIPIVDAGMRELWHTGSMHNRVRMIVASFLTKNLLIPWQEGAKWFMDTLVDADEASNSASWQWVAGCGLDASPYFRIFNPVTQGEKFDSDGLYVKKWIPELKNLDKKYIHQPWTAPKADLALAGVELGKTYPLPIIGLKSSRERALKAYKHIT